MPVPERLSAKPNGRGEGAKTIRCAIYTRKSTEEGLEQEFNSLDAQAEACAAYIASQRHEGWSPVDKQYDDGGYSGGSMERPGLKRLMADVEAGKVDVIVVYKVDRLTRALSDFAKIVDILDGAGASFVSVTQSFNTTTSMGRLTLNVLLSFAQFEREVTGERIRDKIAASKKKGMWMGGPLPLGYDVKDRKLMINEKEAKIVRHIFDRYCALKSIGELAGELERDGIRSKPRTYRSGRKAGNQIFGKGALAHLLQNRIFIGEITHKDQSYAGEHKPIIDRKLWGTLQALIHKNRNNHRLQSQADQPSPFAGMLTDGLGRAMTPTHAKRGNRRYRYYVTRPQNIDGKSLPDAWRIPAREIERPIQARLAAWLRDEANIAATLSDLASKVPSQTLISNCAELAIRIETATPSRLRDILLCIDLQIKLSEGAVTLNFDASKLAEHIYPQLHVSGSDTNVTISIAMTLAKRGQELRLVFASSEPVQTKRIDTKLIGLIAKAEAAYFTLASGESVPSEQRPHLARLARLRFLAPDIVTAILEGRQPAMLSSRKVLRATGIPHCWKAQRVFFGFE